MLGDRKLTTMDLVEYKLYDVETGNVYSTWVPPQEVSALDIDELRRFRLLNKLKAKEAKPDGRWADLTLEPPVSSTRAHPPPAAKASAPAQAPARCAQGAKGGKWKGNTPTLFLNECLPFRRDLRGLRVADKVFQDISDSMFHTHQLDYSWEQLKEKIRSLKRYFSEAKQGKHGGTNWPHYWLMVHIYDAELDVDVSVPRRCLNFQSPSSGSINVTVTGSNQAEPQPSSKSSNVVSSRHALDELQPSCSKSSVVSSSPTADERDPDEQDNCMALPLDLNDNEEMALSLDLNDNVEIHFSPILSSTYRKSPVESTFIGGDIIDSGKELAAPETPSKLHPFKGVACNNSPSSPAAKKRRTLVDLCSSPKQTTPRKTPRKTPKRKLPKSDLQWPGQQTESFLAMCLQWKDHVQRDEVPIQTWKDTSVGLSLSGEYQATWQACREKFQQLKEFFFKSVLPAQGVLYGTKWPYYDTFCQLFDVPGDVWEMLDEQELKNLQQQQDVDHDDLNDENDDPDDERSGSNRLWNKQNVSLLLSLYEAKHKQFASSKSAIRHAYLYAQMSKEMGLFSYNISWQQCKRKVQSMLAKCRKEFDRCKGTGAAPSTWPYYEQVLKFFEGTSTLEPPVAMSVGVRAAPLKVNGKVEEVKQRSTRGRPSFCTNKKSPAAKAKPKKQIYKSWLQEHQEKQEEQRKKVYEEVRLLREGTEKGREVRTLQIDRVLQVLEKISLNRQRIQDN